MNNYWQWVWRYALACVISMLIGFTVEATPKLTGEFTQGGLVRGQLAPDAEVKLNGVPISVNSKGQFVFGFGRDAQPTQLLEWRLSGTTSFDSLQITISRRDYVIDYIEGVEQKYVSPPEDVLHRIRDNNLAIANARQTLSDLTDFDDTFILPAQGRISGVYGSQRYFNGQPRRPHFGLDIANKTGTPVIAPAGGVVTLVHSDMYYSGGTLIIDHGMGISSTFIHLSKLHVILGQRVEQGELIAEIGATGRVTGPHLDWRVNWLTERLDPALLLAESVEYESR